MAKKKKVAVEKKLYYPYKPPKKKLSRCENCGQEVAIEHVYHRSEKWPYDCDIQLRLCVFKDMPGTVEGFLQSVFVENGEDIWGIDIDLHRHVRGRKARKNEMDYYAKHGTLNGLVPWCMIRSVHSCELK